MSETLTANSRLPASRSRAVNPWLVLIIACLAQFMVVLDASVVNIALPALQRDFAPATLSDVSWILAVYAIVLAALLLPAGRAADSIGRRECFLAGLVIFGAASLGCAVASGLPALIACRALQAAGAAVLMPTSLGLALSAFPPRQRGTAVGVWAGVGAVAAGSGPVMGGLLIGSSWRWIFLINLPVVLAAWVAGLVESADLTLLPLFGVHAGFAERTALLMLAVFMAGNVVLSLPVLALFAMAQKQLVRAVNARG